MRRLAARWVAGLLLATLGAAAAGAEDPRGLELLHLECRSAGVWSDLTLFASGMVRLRERTGREEPRMRLLQLDVEALAGYERRIAAEDLSETDAEPLRAQGLVAESCRLAVRQPGESGWEPAGEFRFGRLDSLSLALSHLVALARELEERVRQEASRGQLPADYEPRPGDVLLRQDGKLYRVVAGTPDGRGIELVGIDQPLTIYVAVDSLSGEFSEVVERGRP